jgi:acetylglutamate/LysW-gamma-L-alpha-aminoadipate kinase
VDGDRMAARIAGALHAEKLVLLTDVESLTLDGKPVSKLTLEEAKDALQKIGYGMITKIHAASEALEAGIDQVLIGSGLKEAPLSSCLEHLTGTVITRE